MDELDTPTLLILAVVIVLVLKPDLLSSLFGSSSSASGGGYGYPTGGGGGYLQPPPANVCPAGTAWDGRKCIGLGFHPNGSNPLDPGIPVDLAPNPANPGGGSRSGATKVANDPNVRAAIGLPPIDPGAEPPPSRSGAFGNAIANALAAVAGQPPAPEPPRSAGAPDSVAVVKAANRAASTRFTPFGG